MSEEAPNQKDAGRGVQRGVARAVVLGSESHSEAAPEPPPVGRARSPKGHKRGDALPRIRSDLGEPAGLLSWEREFLLPLALDVLNDFVSSSDGGTLSNGRATHERQPSLQGNPGESTGIHSCELVLPPVPVANVLEDFVGTPNEKDE